MIHWNLINNTERMTQWADFREHLRSLPRGEILSALAEWFQGWPLGARCVDYYTPDSWPTPWEILHDGLFCANTAAILMYDTLHIVCPDVEATVVLVNDHGDEYLAVAVGDQILNVNPGELVSKHDVEIVQHHTVSRNY